MKQLFSICAIAICLVQGVYAQQQCATTEYMQQQLIADPGYAQRLEAIEQFTQNFATTYDPSGRVVYTIPVVFHVVWNTTSENISDTRVLENLDVLNDDFRRLNADASNTPVSFQDEATDMEINFCLAAQDPSGNATTGILRVNTTKTSFSSNDDVKKTANGGSDAWDRNKYLNIWICDLSSGLLGYAQFPGGPANTDGIVVDYATVGGPNAPGTLTPFHLGRTATHEVGHWVNLYHIWGDDGSGCSGTDLVSDTPNQAGATSGCPSYPKTDGCTGSSPGVMFMNYMDYSDDACMNMFTAGQKTRAQAIFASGGSRASISTSPGCTVPGGGTCSTPTGLSATGITSSGATLNWNAVSSATSYNVQYKLSSSSTWTTTTSTTNSKALSGLTANSTYNYQIQAVCGTSSSAYSAQSSFTTSAASCSDTYESNNTKGSAKTVPVGTTFQALIGSSTDKDWFKWTNTSSTPHIKVTMTSLPADYDMKLYNTSGSYVAVSENGNTDDEQIIYNNGAVGTWKLQVYGYNGAFNTSDCYDVLIQLSGTPWRLDESESGIVNEYKLGISNIYPNPSNGDITVEYNTKESGELTFLIHDMMGRTVLTQLEPTFEGNNAYYFNVRQLSSGMYFMEVRQGESSSIVKFTIE